MKEENHLNTEDNKSIEECEMPIRYRKFHRAVENRRSDEITVYDHNLNVWRNVKMPSTKRRFRR